MSSTDVTIVVVDPAELKPADAKKLPVREGDEAWKIADLRQIVELLNSDVERLVTEGRMRASGLAEVDKAKADGRWERAYDGSSTIEVPPDLDAALDAEPVARAAFDGLSRQDRYAVLYRIGAVKRAETRARRIDEFVARLAAGETAFAQRRKPGTRGI